MATAEELNQISDKIIRSAINVHKALGPGLLESAYEACLVHELRGHRILVETQKTLPVVYRDLQLECGYRLDIFVEIWSLWKSKLSNRSSPSISLNCVRI